MSRSAQPIIDAARTAGLHPFEYAGIGKAPFSISRYFRRGRTERVACQFCGERSLLHVFCIRSKSGTEALVGRNCVTLVDSPDLREQGRLAEAEYLLKQSDVRAILKKSTYRIPNPRRQHCSSDFWKNISGLDLATQLLADPTRSRMGAKIVFRAHSRLVKLNRIRRRAQEERQ